MKGAPPDKATLLIDGDLFVFQAASAVEQETQWGTWLWTLHSDVREAIPILEGKVETLLSVMKLSHIECDVVFALTDEENWRKGVMPTYKWNRVDKRKPLAYAALREYVKEKWTTYQRPTLEGDDIIGILATSTKLIPGAKIVVSIDKDLKGIPGLLIREEWQAGVPLAIEEVTEEDADYFHMYQTLTGDQSDGYQGCPGIGPVKAEKALETVKGDRLAMWQTVVGLYQKAGLSEQVALTNARVARICRNTDYNFAEKKVRLWQPPE